MAGLDGMLCTVGFFLAGRGFLPSSFFFLFSFFFENQLLEGVNLFCAFFFFLLCDVSTCE
jgi:hypothetical protein